ncbi:MULTISPECIES: hypothetical protein [Acinetobacter]|uniref:Uncharacterized protein n=1 Tax=Acinetobacter variabilis TaxID=70346 RepID=N9P5N5_9GAMM|nr:MULTISPECIES: hypothetical protein [Acinetobacter]ENX09475.1 hypothetical protein F897_01565 [Acinetobacter variabilis]QKW82517.1 hypothetical protein FOC32_09610 [Acinetobacter sp. FDAARGOS_724]UBI30616.1 hypothetical protein LA331_00050 [Acinetobacter variabilis]
MLKKILLVLLILAPSALYIYVISRDDKTAENQAETTPAEKTPTEQYQTPDH